MANPNNNGTIIGRVAQEPRQFDNSDGSKTLLVTIAVDDNFKSGKDKKAQTQYIPVRVYLPKSVNGLGSWDRVHVGDLISLNYRLARTPFEKAGKTVYPELSAEVEGFPQFLEPKTITDARAARRAVAAATPAAAAEETDTEKIARLQAELAATGAPQENFDTTPFAAAQS